jgi:hypothetical protein
MMNEIKELKPKQIRRNSEKSRTIKRTFEERWSKIDIKDLARQHTQNALQTLVEIMGDNEAPANARLNAANSLLDRGWGKSTTHTEVSIDIYDRMSDEELIVFINESLPNLPKTIEHKQLEHDGDDNDSQFTDQE